jgi:hypothetical protein
MEWRVRRGQQRLGLAGMDRTGKVEGERVSWQARTAGLVRIGAAGAKGRGWLRTARQACRAKVRWDVSVSGIDWQARRQEQWRGLRGKARRILAGKTNERNQSR